MLSRDNDFCASAVVIRFMSMLLICFCRCHSRDFVVVEIYNIGSSVCVCVRGVEVH